MTKVELRQLIQDSYLNSEKENTPKFDDEWNKIDQSDPLQAMVDMDEAKRSFIITNVIDTLTDVIAKLFPNICD